MPFPVFDLHCDTALALLGDCTSQRRQLFKNQLMVDLERAEKLGGYCQCFACYTTPNIGKRFHKTPTDVFELEIDCILSELDKNCDKIAIAYTAVDVENNLNAGIMSAVLTLEGTAGFHYDPALLEDLYNLGFRIVSLGWNESNPLTGSHLTGEGLTEQGRVFVQEAQRLGMIVDVSHISDRGFWDIMEITAGPIVATHSNSRTICNHSRNLTDEMFTAICSTGGVAGINLYSEFIGQNATLETVANHILHFLKLDPDGKHIALGGDLDGCDVLPKGFCGIQDYPCLAEQLLSFDIAEQTVRDIFWNNALGVMKNAVPNHKK